MRKCQYKAPDNHDDNRSKTCPSPKSYSLQPTGPTSTFPSLGSFPKLSEKGKRFFAFLMRQSLIRLWLPSYWWAMKRLIEK